MKITALEEYGLRCLLQVASQHDGEAISAQTIAEKEGLSLPYTQKILRILSMGGLIDSRRGAQGGFYLTSSPDRITLGDAMRVLGGLIEIEDICERHTGELKTCSNQCNCSIRPVWLHISHFLISTLDGIPLSVLIQDETSVARHLKRVREAYSSAHL
jgi:Rrf2 family transcriptional regulator, iron-sulfur cluster assembly transcription factor